MSARQAERKWVVTVQCDESDDWPDIDREDYRITFRPHVIVITFAEDPSAIGAKGVTASGQRVHKDGTLGNSDGEAWHRISDCPAWIASLAAEILADEILPTASTERADTEG